MAGETKKCPFCAEEIKVDAVKCKYCDSILEKTVTSDSASIETKDEKNSVFIKKCPFCAEEINVNDIKCKYCDSNLEKVTTNNSPLSTKKEIKNKKNIPASKGILFILLAFIFLLYLHNKSIIQIPVLTSPYQSEMEEVIKQDSRNEGISVSIYTRGPAILVYDIKSFSGDKTITDMFRVFLQFAEKLSKENFKEVYLANKGEVKFKIKGNYFKQLGEEYSEQNPIYTMRTFPENVLNPDGTNAYSGWEGGILGVTTKQLEDFNDLNQKWYFY